MAEKRMFTKRITNSDDFLSMPNSTQNLYFHLNMEADDEGFVNSPKRIMRTILASEDDLKLLLLKRFVIGFESGVIVIKHWKMHNTLRKDRFKPTDYHEEKALLVEKENGVYTECQPSDNQVTTIGMHSIDKYSVVENSKEKKGVRFTPPTLQDVTDYIVENKYNVNAETFINHYEAVGWKVGKNKMKDWKASVRGWHSRNKKETKTEIETPSYMTDKKGGFGDYEEVD